MSFSIPSEPFTDVAQEGDTNFIGSCAVFLRSNSLFRFIYFALATHGGGTLLFAVKAST
jgi:hypothetical protein